MNFTIRFRSEYGNPISAPSRDVGLNQLDEARLASGVLALASERVQGYVVARHVGNEVRISEEVARDSGHFVECNEIEVSITNHTKYHVLEPRIAKDGATGEVSHIQFVWGIDEGAILADWAGDGYPLVWENEE